MKALLLTFVVMVYIPAPSSEPQSAFVAVAPRATPPQLFGKPARAAAAVSMTARVKDYDRKNPPCEVLELFYLDMLYGKRSEERNSVLLGFLPKLEKCFVEGKDQITPETAVLYVAHVKHALTGDISHFKDMPFDFKE